MLVVKPALRSLNSSHSPIGMSVDFYIDLVFDNRAAGTHIDVSSLYTNLPMNHGGFDGRLKELRECKITQLLLCKATDIWQHEFVLTFVHHHANPDHPRILRLERRSNPTDQSSIKRGKPNANTAKDTVKYYDTLESALNAGFS